MFEYWKNLKQRITESETYDFLIELLILLGVLAVIGLVGGFALTAPLLLYLKYHSSFYLLLYTIPIFALTSFFLIRDYKKYRKENKICLRS